MERPLEGIKIIEVAEMISGPYCGKMLADLGGQVIKIERPDFGDEARRRGPFLPEVDEHDGSILFLYLNLGKQGITLDLRNKRGQRIFQNLIREADVLIEDIPVGEKAAMGLDPEEIRVENPGLIHISVTPFGATGPNKDLKTHHLNRYMAGGDGYCIFVRDEDLWRPPIQGPGYLGDYETGTGAAIAVMGALFHRDASGEGQFIDCSAQEWSIFLNSLYLFKYPNENLVMDRSNMRYSLAGIMECRDGYVMLLLIEDHHWWRMVKAMGDPAWAFEERFNTNYKRTQHAEEINGLIQAWLHQHTKDELYHELQKQGIPFSPISSPGEVLESPQLKSRGFFFEHEHPLAGKLVIPSVPYMFSERTNEKSWPAPRLGEHNQDVYGLLGYTNEEIAGLRQEGII